MATTTFQYDTAHSGLVSAVYGGASTGAASLSALRAGTSCSFAINDYGSSAHDNMSANGTTNKYNTCYRGFLKFDTSSLPNDAVITAAVLNNYSHVGGVTNFSHSPLTYFVSFIPATPSTPVATDYNYFGTSSFGTDAPSVGIRSTTLGSGFYAMVSKTGYTYLGTKGYVDFTNTSQALTSGYSYQDYSDVTSVYAGSTFNLSLTYYVSPTVTTQACSALNKTQVTANGTISATGDQNATRRGFCYIQNTVGDPTTADSVVYDDGSFSTGAYALNITGLTANTSYRVRAYAINGAGTSYGTTVTVLTLTDAVVTTTAIPTSVSTTAMNIQGNITTTGNQTNSRGICYKVASSAGDPTTADSLVTDTGDFAVGTFIKTLPTLTSGRSYKYRAYVINNAGTYYGATYTYAPEGWYNPANMYTDDANYAEMQYTTNGDLGVEISINGGTGYSSKKKLTFTGSDTSQVAGGTGDTWGKTITGTYMGNTYFKIRLSPFDDATTNNSQVLGTFGFSISNSYYITGLDVSVKGNWDGLKFYITNAKVIIHYGTAVTPVIQGSVAYASDCPKALEPLGSGTGNMVFWDGSNWLRFDTGDQVGVDLSTYTVQNVTTGTTTLTDTGGERVIILDSTGGTITLNLPAATSGAKYVLKCINATNTITVNRNATPGTDNIFFSSYITSFKVGVGSSIVLHSNKSNLWIVT